MNLEYNYWFFKSAIPSFICDQIIEMGLTAMYDHQEKHGEQSIHASTGGWREKQEGSDAIPVNSSSAYSLKKKGIDPDKGYVRDSKVVFLGNQQLFDLVWPYVHEANKSANWNFDWDFTEDFQFTKYNVGQFYGWHTDSSSVPFQRFDPDLHPIRRNSDGTPRLSPDGSLVPEEHFRTPNDKLVGKIRKLSMTISLNDHKEYAGGNLRFDLGPHRSDRYHTCHEIRPKGSIVVFPSHIQHQVTPVTRGTRYSLVSWHLGPPFK